MNYDTLTIDELKKGYRFDSEADSYLCNWCNQRFEVGRVYDIDTKLYEAARAVMEHVRQSHHEHVKQLLHVDNKYNTLTDNQKELLFLMYSDRSDKEIAKVLGISPSTVRHQRFVFREKAKQARMYLAQYEAVTETRSDTEQTLVPIHANATMVDDRYVVTEKERVEILNAEFETLSPLKLKRFPKKEKRKLVILARIAEQLEPGRTYTEKELNDILVTVFEDYVVLRRYLIEYGFMDRTSDGKEYWLT
ncbi:MAG: DUF2087 domain-containing protein [Sphaerochaetaceae bacterium]|jgi:DNA-binding CsgD family transcriptional regulator|nr:DUF2087 domain-containing protein [Sphaerochaetaceae bacterium]NLO60499.1 DUF2087 domain-containing protein [Spirochaetales bacterium]MDD2406392.1 DUF2087 domain-containing protein [Sphaerochaetaceae bacterium]MDD3670278.1 DUF2087 domain-containing protein [Sphaerochaetaceae bacterium]MDD4258707.1 DUF2087 domain-containing protein [Sphaerochaetaceae bacterium]